MGASRKRSLRVGILVRDDYVISRNGAVTREGDMPICDMCIYARKLHPFPSCPRAAPTCVAPAGIIRFLRSYANACWHAGALSFYQSCRGWESTCGGDSRNAGNAALIEITTIRSVLSARARVVFFNLKRGLHGAFLNNYWHASAPAASKIEIFLFDKHDS